MQGGWGLNSRTALIASAVLLLVLNLALTIVVLSNTLDSTETPARPTAITAAWSEDDTHYEWARLETFDSLVMTTHAASKHNLTAVFVLPSNVDWVQGGMVTAFIGSYGFTQVYRLDVSSIPSAMLIEVDDVGTSFGDARPHQSAPDQQILARARRLYSEMTGVVRSSSLVALPPQEGALSYCADSESGADHSCTVLGSIPLSAAPTNTKFKLSAELCGDQLEWSFIDYVTLEARYVGPGSYEDELLLTGYAKNV